MTAEYIFDRGEERERIAQRLAEQSPFLILGPAGVGKTLLLHSVLSEFPTVLACENSTTINAVFRSLALSLLRLGSRRAKLAFRGEDAIPGKSAVSLKGIVMDALREGRYSIVLDYLNRPPQSFSSAVREIMGWGATPVSAVARSSHMEDTGFLQTLYGDRSQKCEIRNFDAFRAEQFAHEVVKRDRVAAPNLGEFLDKVLRFSAGNPGTIMALIRMANYPKYRFREHIKIAPLYIDFCMNWSPTRRHGESVSTR